MSDTSGWLDDMQQGEPTADPGVPSTEGWLDDMQQDEQTAQGEGVPSTEGWLDDMQQQQATTGQGVPGTEGWLDGMATSPSPVLDLQRMLEDPAIANDPIAVQAIMTQIQAANHNIALWGGPYKVVDEGDHVTEYYPD